MTVSLEKEPLWPELTMPYGPDDFITDEADVGEGWGYREEPGGSIGLWIGAGLLAMLGFWLFAGAAVFNESDLIMEKGLPAAFHEFHDNGIPAELIEDRTAAGRAKSPLVLRYVSVELPGDELLRLNCVSSYGRGTTERIYYLHEGERLNRLARHQESKDVDLMMIGICEEALKQ